MKKRLGLILFDFFLINVTTLAVQWFMNVHIDRALVLFGPVIAVVDIAILVLNRFYNHKIEGSSTELVWAPLEVFGSAAVALFIILGVKIGFTSFFTRYAFISQIACCCIVLFSRILMRSYKESMSAVASQELPKAIVYGAGELGSAIARMSIKGLFDYQIEGFIDDNPDLKDSYVMRYPVLGSSKDMGLVFKNTDASTLIIAITKIESVKIQQAILAAKEHGLDVKIIPKLFESNNLGKVSVRDVGYADLLGRDLITIEREPLEDMFAGKTILVTGAGGSIGSEICTQLRTFNLKKLVLLDIDETELHDLCLRLLDYRREWSEEVYPVVCDIKNKAKLENIFNLYKPDIVFHAAAYKHVPLMELYPEEAILTNIPGSYNVFNAAVKSNVKRVVVISTDKAVNPTNIMGATKRTVEMMASTFNDSSDTDFCCVRFGNVIGSRGSMLPLFLEQIKAGKPITVTDRKIYRYFMAIPEAVSLVFRAATLAKGGEVMVLDMGQPVNIYDFAQKLITVFGDSRSSIRITGLRPGEKLYEELLADKDNNIPTENDKIFKAKINHKPDWTVSYLEGVMNKMDTLSVTQLVEELKKTVPEYHHN